MDGGLRADLLVLDCEGGRVGGGLRMNLVVDC